jgi:hypothetical protein
MAAINQKNAHAGKLIVFAGVLSLCLAAEPAIAQVRIPQGTPIPANPNPPPPRETPAGTEDVMAASVHISSPDAALTLTDTRTQKDAAIRIMDGDVHVSTVVRSELSLPGRRVDTSNYRELVTFDAGGNVGIGTRDPLHRVTIVGGPTWTSNGWKGALELENGAALAWRANTGQHRFGIGHTNGGLFFFRTASDPGRAEQPAVYDLNIKDDGTVSVRTLEIAGADLAEKFSVRAASSREKEDGTAIQPGYVVAIDTDNPGQLVVSDRAFDRRVAGVISGAGSVHVGVVLGHDATITSNHQPVALTGRVYCWADTSAGAIRPGDLLTTSARPGHAMRVDDPARAQGAILGKAMTHLDDGVGLVLVLVTLQ